MTPEERAAGMSTADAGDWPTSPSMPAGAAVPADDDSADLISSDLRYAATFLGCAVLIIAAGVAIVAVMS